MNPFHIGEVSLSYLADGVIPLSDFRESPFVLLTDGNTSPERHGQYKLLLGREDIQLIHISERPELTGPFLLVVEEARRGIRQTLDPNVHARKVVKRLLTIQLKLQKQFPKLFG